VAFAIASKDMEIQELKQAVPDAAFVKSRGSNRLEKSTVMAQINVLFFKSECSYRTLITIFFH
jgi:hypothetical protein